MIILTFIYFIGFFILYHTIQKFPYVTGKNTLTLDNLTLNTYSLLSWAGLVILLTIYISKIIYLIILIQYKLAKKRKLNND